MVCALNPISNKPSKMEQVVGVDNYSKIIDKFYDMKNIDFLMSFYGENTYDIYDPQIMDENNDFKLYKRFKNEVGSSSPAKYKYIYIPLERDPSTGEYILDSEYTDSLVILPTVNVLTVEQNYKPYIDNTLGVERIVSMNDVSVPVDDVDSYDTDKIMSEAKQELNEINSLLNQNFETLFEARLHTVRSLDTRQRNQLLTILVNKIPNSIKKNMTKRELHAYAFRTALLKNDPFIKRAIDNKLKQLSKSNSSAVKYRSVTTPKNKKYIDLIHTMNTEVHHDETIDLDEDQNRRINPLTGQYILNHTYYMLKDKDGKVLEEPRKMTTGVTTEIDKANPFNRYRLIMDIDWGKRKGDKFKWRWTKYISDKALKLLMDVDEEIIQIDPYTELENTVSRGKKTLFNTKQSIVDIVKAANKGEQGKEEIFNILRDLSNNAVLLSDGSRRNWNVSEFNAVLSSLTGMTVNSKVEKVSSLTFKTANPLRTYIDKKTGLEKEYHHARNNLVDKLRALNFGTIAGTYVHGITQATMISFMFYNGDFEAMIKAIEEDSNNEHKDFLEYAREISTLKKEYDTLSDEEKLKSNYYKIKESIDKAKKTIEEFKNLAATKYSATDELGNKVTEPYMFFENVVLTRKYGSLTFKNNPNNNELASKVDVTVVFPNGKMFVIDIKSSSKDNVRGSRVSEVNSTLRYNSEKKQEVVWTITDENGNKITKRKDETIEEGYIKSEQEKHVKQLEVYRKIYIDRGVDPNDIETYIYFTAVEELDKSGPIQNVNEDGTYVKDIDNVIDKITRLTVPDFSLPNGDKDNQINRVSEYSETGPLSHMIPGPTLSNFAQTREVVNNIIGEKIEDIERNKQKEEAIRIMEQNNTKEQSEQQESFEQQKDAIKAKILYFIQETEINIRNSNKSDKEKELKLENLKKLKENINNEAAKVVDMISFINFVHKELVTGFNIADSSSATGMSKSDSLVDYMISVVDAYDQNIEKEGVNQVKLLNDSIADIQFIYDIVSEMSALLDIRKLRDLVPETLFDEEQSKKLNESIAMYDTVLEIYNTRALEMLSKVLYDNHDIELDAEYETRLRNKLRQNTTLRDSNGKIIKEGLFEQSDIDEYKKRLEAGEDMSSNVKNNIAFGHIHKIMDELKHLKITQEEIEQELRVLHKDIGGVALYTLGVGMQNNRSMQLLFKQFKKVVANAEHKTKSDMILLDEAFQKYKSIVGSNANMEKLYGRLLEKKKILMYDSETGEFKEEDVWQFIEEYDTNYKLELNRLKAQRREARLQKNKARELELTEEIKNWERENLQNIYSDAYYEAEKMLTDRKFNISITTKDGQKLNKVTINDLISQIEEEIFEIRVNYNTNNAFEYSVEDKAKIDKLYAKKRALADTKDEKGNDKTGEELELAKYYNEYKEKMNAMVDWELDVDLYTKALNIAKAKYKNDPIKLQRWIDENTDLILSPSFFEERAFYAFNKDLLWTLEQYRLSKDPAIKAKYDAFDKAYNKNMMLFGSTDPVSYIDTMKKYLIDNEIELEKSTDKNLLEIIELMKPYRNKSGYVDETLIPKEIKQKILDIQQKLSKNAEAEFRKSNGRVAKMDNKSPYKSAFIRNATTLSGMQSWDIKSEYYDELNRIKDELRTETDTEESLLEKVKQTEWWKENHIVIRKTIFDRTGEPGLSPDYNPLKNHKGWTRVKKEGSEEYEEILSGYMLVEKEVPINTWTRMIPSSQEGFLLNKKRLDDLFNLFKKYKINSSLDIEFNHVSDDGTITPKKINTTSTDLLQLLQKDKNQLVLENEKIISDSDVDVSGNLSMNNNVIGIDGNSVPVRNILDALFDSLNKELRNDDILPKDSEGNVNPESKDDLQKILDYLNKYSVARKVTNKDGKVETQYKMSNSIYETEAKESKLYQKRPSIKFSRRKVKKAYHKPEKELREMLSKESFSNGDRKTGEINYERLRPLPKKEKWSNEKYKKLMNDDSKEGLAVKEFYEFMVDFYLKKQSKYPPHKRRGLIIPAIRKSGNESLIEGNTKDKLERSLRRVKDVFKTAEDDYDEEGRALEGTGVLQIDEEVRQREANLYGKSYSNSAITLPTYFVQHMNADDVSLDLISSMQLFAAASNKYENLSGMINTVKMMNTAFNLREKNKGVLERDNKNRLLIKSLAEQMGIEGLIKFKGKDDTSNIQILFKKFVEMQFAGINNKPSYAGKIRIDKVMDGLMLSQSFASIGGISPLAAVKGTINSLQASISIAIEAAGGEFFDKSTIREVLRVKSHAKLWSDMAKEIAASAKGSTIAVTHTGLLLEHYDALQGNFEDSLGNNVSATAASKLIRSNTWFFNQYIGEYLNSMTVLNAFLEERKILDDGTVMTWDQYRLGKYLPEIDKEKRAAIEKMSDTEYKKAKKDFKKRPSLRSAIKQDESGKQLIVDAVNINGNEVKPKWKLGDDKDLNLRLKVQAIQREINGAYAQADKTIAQQYWYGRALIMYKKHLAPSIVRRFGYGDGLASQELGSVRVGYHRDHYKMIWEAFIKKQTEETKELLAIYKNFFSFGLAGGMIERREGKIYTKSQIANIRKSLFEHTMLLTMTLLGALFLEVGDDEDKNQVSESRWLALFVFEKLRREQNALAINFLVGNPVKDNWKNLESPSALIKTVNDLLDIVGLASQHVSPFASDKDLYYQQNSGIAEKGDSRLKIKMLKSFKNLTPTTKYSGQTARTLYENMNM